MAGSDLFTMGARALQFLWALLVMALSGNMIHDSWSGSKSTPSIVNFAIVCSIFGMASLFYLIPATLRDSFRFHAAAPFALDLLNTILWFCAAVAFAAELGAHSCTDYSYLVSNKITNSGPNFTKMCREGQATTAFLWFGWAAFLASTVLTGLQIGGGSTSSRVRAPQMAKV